MRKTQKEIGMIAGIILTITTMIYNLVGNEVIRWIIRDTDLSLTELKTYSDDYELWKENDAWNIFEKELLKNERKRKQKE